MEQSMKNVMGHLFKSISESRSQDLSILRECAEVLSKCSKALELAKAAQLLQDFADNVESDQIQVAVELLSTAYQTECEWLGDCDGCLRCKQTFYTLLYRKYIVDGGREGGIDRPEWYEPEPAALNTMELQPLRQELDELFRRRSQPKDYYELLHERLSANSHPENFFINLKGMSSSSPILYNSALHTEYAGGGFYVRWEGVGIVVDPGYNFLKNLGDYLLTLFDIDFVIITHDHIDHNHDARLLVDLAYQLKRDKHIQWYVDTETAKLLEMYLEPELSDTVHMVSATSPSLEDSGRLRLNDRIVLKTFQTKHIPNATYAGSGKSKYSDRTFGFCLELTGRSSSIYRIGYTSDTSFFSELPKNLDGVDLLIANISSVYKEELVKEHQNDWHLGLTGIQKLIQGLTIPPHILALSEFWSGIVDIRYDITKFVGTYFSSYAKDHDWLILPLELGTTISLPDSKVKCSRCGHYEKRVYMLRPNADFDEILFACQRCIY